MVELVTQAPEVINVELVTRICVILGLAFFGPYMASYVLAKFMKMI